VDVKSMLERIESGESLRSVIEGVSHKNMVLSHLQALEDQIVEAKKAVVQSNSSESELIGIAVQMLATVGNVVRFGVSGPDATGLVSDFRQLSRKVQDLMTELSDQNR
jgi:hypothetical protein